MPQKKQVSSKEEIDRSLKEAKSLVFYQVIYGTHGQYGERAVMCFNGQGKPYIKVERAEGKDAMGNHSWNDPEDNEIEIMSDALLALLQSMEEKPTEIDLSKLAPEATKV